MIRRWVLLSVGFMLLTGFGDKKAEVLVKRCVERGKSEKTCRCAIRVHEEALGQKFLEAMYLQIIGDLQGYEKKLYEIVAENPKILEIMDEVEARAKKQCGR